MCYTAIDVVATVTRGPLMGPATDTEKDLSSTIRIDHRG
jgi:hypothetical protein